MAELRTAQQARMQRGTARRALAALCMAACCRRHRVLDGVSGCFPHSTLHAIMGPSGCGKSSFLNVLSGRAHYGTPTGALFVNSELAGNMERLRHLVSTKQRGRFTTGLARSAGHIAATRWACRSCRSWYPPMYESY